MTNLTQEERSATAVYLTAMITDDDDATQPNAPNAEHLIGLEVRHSTPPEQRRPKRSPRSDRRQYVRESELVPSIVLESQLGWMIVCRIGDGEWSTDLIADATKASTFNSRERADGILVWLRSVAEREQTGAEYMILPVLAAERGL